MINDGYVPPIACRTQLPHLPSASLSLEISGEHICESIPSLHRGCHIKLISLYSSTVSSNSFRTVASTTVTSRNTWIS